MDLPKHCTTRLLDQNFGMCITPQDLILPFYNFHGTNYFRPWKISPESANNDFGSTIDNSRECFKIALDVQHFKPNEVNVKVTDKEVIIEGNHEERQDDHGFISRQFIRRYALPNDCLSETVTSTLSSDGILTVMANKKFDKDIKANGKVIPVKVCGPCPKIDKSKITTTDSKTIKNGVSDILKEINLDKKTSEIILKDDHSRLLKPELLKEAVSGTDKILIESRKETDELLKLISADKTAQANVTSDKLEDVLGQCKTAIAELTEKFSETSITGSSEMSSMKSSMVSETIESVETSSSMSSSTSSSKKATSEKCSELLICAELKEAAEYT